MTAKKTPAKPIKVTPRIEAEAIALWESGEFKSKADVARHLHIPVSAAMRVLKDKEKGKTESKIRAAVSRDLAAEVASEASLRAARIRESKEEHYKMATGLAKLTWAEVVAAKTAGMPMATIAANLKALDIAMSVLKKAREERFAVLGILDGEETAEDDLPQLIVSELTPEQVEEMRNAQDDDDVIEAPEVEEDEATSVVDTTGGEEEDEDGVVES